MVQSVKKLKLWLDDVRPMPPDFDVHVTRGEIAIELIKFGIIKEISFDHDLGENCYSGYDVAKYIEEGAWCCAIDRIKWSVHSDNPVGIQNITAAMLNAESYWDKIIGGKNK